MLRRRVRLHGARSAASGNSFRRHGLALQRSDRRNERTFRRNAAARRDQFRHAWTQPLVFSQADPHALYYANQFLYKTTNGGESWTQISQDMTREDPGVPANLNEAAAADAPADKRRGVIYTIAPSPLRAPMIWIGTDDGLIHLTNDDGKTWQNVTPPALTSWSKVVDDRSVAL